MSILADIDLHINVDGILDYGDGDERILENATSTTPYQQSSSTVHTDTKIHSGGIDTDIGTAYDKRRLTEKLSLGPSAGSPS